MIIIQARLNSSRFPRKIESEIQGVPVLHRVIDASTRAIGHTVVLAIPEGEANDPFFKSTVERFSDLRIFAGSEHSVGERFRGAFNENRDAFDHEGPSLGLVRVCADRPFLSTALINSLSHTANYEYELLFNHMPHEGSGPRGYGAESVSKRLAIDLFDGTMFDHVHPEHVTLNLYELDEIRKKLVVPPEVMRAWEALGKARLDIDVPSDSERLEALASEFSLELIRSPI